MNQDAPLPLLLCLCKACKHAIDCLRGAGVFHQRSCMQVIQNMVDAGVQGATFDWPLLARETLNRMTE
jgi:hypothetical protein